VRSSLRKAFGFKCVSEHEYRKARDALHASIPALRLHEGVMNIGGCVSSPHASSVSPRPIVIAIVKCHLSYCVTSQFHVCFVICHQ
jgi:hypothetical protein